MSDYDVNDVIDQFRLFAYEQGVQLPENIIADGRRHRFKVDGDKSSQKSGSYKLFLDDSPAGSVQNWKTDEHPTTWGYKNPNYKRVQQTPQEREQRIMEMREKAEKARIEEAESQAQAAIRARQEWNRTKQSNSSPYTDAKGVGLHNARVNNYKGVTQLIIPLQDKAGNFRSLQRIQMDAENPDESIKMLFKDAQKQGTFSVLNKQPAPQIIAIAEGFATTASIIEDSYSVANKVMGVMAVDAGNLKAVAEAMRELHPNAEILVFGDIGDKALKGEKSAKEAAEAVNGYVVLPPIQKGDFNDYLTGKAGDITLSLEQLINQSMDKIMEIKKDEIETGYQMINGQSIKSTQLDLENSLARVINSGNESVENSSKSYFEIGAHDKIPLANAEQVAALAEEMGLNDFTLIQPNKEPVIFRREDGVWFDEKTKDSLSAIQTNLDIANAKDISERADIRQQIGDYSPIIDKSYLDTRLAMVDVEQLKLINGEHFKESAYKAIESNAAISEDYAKALSAEVKQAIDENAQRRAGLESLNDIDKQIEAETAEHNQDQEAKLAELQNGKIYDKFEAYEAGFSAFDGVADEDYPASALPMALEHKGAAYQSRNVELKSEFMLGFIESQAQLPNSEHRSIEEAFKNKLPHLNAEEYIEIARDVVSRKMPYDTIDLPDVPLTLRDTDVSFEVRNKADKESFSTVSEAVERAKELDAFEIIIKDKWQFDNAAYRDKVTGEYLMPDRETNIKDVDFSINTNTGKSDATIANDAKSEEILNTFHVKSAQAQEKFASAYAEFESYLSESPAHTWFINGKYDEYDSITLDADIQVDIDNRADLSRFVKSIGKNNLALEKLDRIHAAQDARDYHIIKDIETRAEVDLVIAKNFQLSGEYADAFTEHHRDALAKNAEVEASQRQEPTPIVADENQKITPEVPVNSIENTAVIAQEITPPNFGDNSDFHIPEPDYSTMPDDASVEYLAAQIQQSESRLEHDSDYYYRAAEGLDTTHAIEAHESAIQSIPHIQEVDYMYQSNLVDVFRKDGDEFIKENSENHAVRSLTQAQEEADFIHAGYIEFRAEHNLTLDRKNKSYPELDVKLSVVDSKEFTLIKGDEYKVKAAQSMAMNAAVSKYYENALPADIKKIVDSELTKEVSPVSPKEPEKLARIEQFKLMAGQAMEQAMAKVKAVNSFPESADIKPSIDITKTPDPAQQVDKPIPKDVTDKYIQVDDKFYFKKNKDVVIFEDKGAKLETKLNSSSVAADLVKIAAERGWKEIKITGTPEFKGEIWMEAEMRGIATMDRAMLKERLAKNTTNTIEEVKVQEKTEVKPNVRRILEESADKKLAEQHIKAHPELKETVEYFSALKKQLEKSGASEQQIKVYMETTKEGLAQMIDAGKYPEYQKVPVQQRQDTKKETVVTKSKPKDQEMEIG